MMWVGPTFTCMQPHPSPQPQGFASACAGQQGASPINRLAARTAAPAARLAGTPAPGRLGLCLWRAGAVSALMQGKG